MPPNNYLVVSTISTTNFCIVLAQKKPPKTAFSSAFLGGGKSFFVQTRVKTEEGVLKAVEVEAVNVI